MIDNCTSSDVSNADLLRKKMQSGQALTETEITAFERGACTINMLNRIEAKQAELSQLMNDYSYRNSIVTKTHTNGDILSDADYIRIVNNLDRLKAAYYTYSTTPTTPMYMYGYQEANAIEKILVDVESMIVSMESKFRQCGTFQCGEENVN